MPHAYTLDSSNHWQRQKAACTKVAIPVAVGKSLPSPAELRAAKISALEEQRIKDTRPGAKAHKFLDDMEAFLNWLNAPPASKPKPAATVAQVTEPAPQVKPIEPFDLQQICKTVEAQGFKLYATLLRKWFDSPRMELSSQADKYALEGSVKLPAANIDTSSITLKALLKYPHVKRAYNQICSAEFLNSPTVRANMVRVLSKLDSNNSGFDLSSQDLYTIHRNYMFASVEAGKPFPEYYDDIKDGQKPYSRDAVDDLELAFGQIKFYAAIHQCRIIPDRMDRRAAVHRIVVYVMTPFCFDQAAGNPQYMGHFNSKQVALVANDGNWIDYAVYRGADMYAKNAVLWPITKGDMREWRRLHNAGGDMLVFSDDSYPWHDTIGFRIPYKRYVVTIYAAAPGTPLKFEGGGTSLPGHMYYVISDLLSAPLSFGFAPIKQGSMVGNGKIHTDDLENYQNPYYSRTLEISEQQFFALKDFGEHPEAYGFSTYYEHAKNNCVDFTWDALRNANIFASTGYAKGMDATGNALKSARIDSKINFEGALRPAENVDSIKSINAPFPDSELNSQKSNEMPKDRSLLQRMLSEDAGQPTDTTRA